jgi:hypothetical protein
MTFVGDRSGPGRLEDQMKNRGVTEIATKPFGKHTGVDTDMDMKLELGPIPVADVEHAKLDGSFRAGSMGEVKLEGQTARKFLITHCEPLQGYTDRYFLPFYGKMDWHHTIKETGGIRKVTFNIEVSGPSALILALIMRNILRDSLPPSIDKLVSLAEEA